MDTETRVERAAGAAPRAGRLRVGARVPTVGGSKASIPSRFETVLNGDVRESNGFGRRTFRFEEPVNDLPGPGAYAKSRSVVNRSQQQLSTSTKGSAAFASGSRSTSHQLGSNVFTPGPAAYDSEKPKAKTANPGPSPAFRAPTEKRLLRVTAVTKDVPGPGSYRVEEVGAAKPGGRFTTLGAREVASPLPPATAPGPGEFVPESHLNLTAAVARTTNRHGSTAPSTAAAKEMKKKAEARQGLPPSMTSEMLAGAVPDVVASAAEDRKDRELHHKVAGALKPLDPKPVTKSSAFADTALDRFGNPTVRYTAGDDGNLGPGAYEPEAKQRRMLVSSSWALSTVERGEKKGRWAVPGPAYYGGSKGPSKVSHHMLSTSYWS